jgi:P4 family phage/plasmid primase-like protien
MAGRNMMPLTSEHVLETKLGQFLDAHRVTEKGEPCSFTGMGLMRGKFAVKDNEYPAFLDLLHEYLFTQRRRPLNLVEQRRCDLVTPLLIDLDFKYPAERAIQRQFEMNHIYEFIRLYVSNLTHYYDLSEFTRPLRFFVTLRPAPYEDKKTTGLNRSIKDGVHIECPDFVVPSEHQQVLRLRSLEHNHVSTAFHATGYINAEKDIFDEAIVKKNGWFFFGESKPDIPAYQLVAIYVYDPTTQEFYEETVDGYTTREVMELLSIRYQLRTHAVEWEEKTQEEWRERMEVCMGKRSGSGICSASGGAGEEEEGVGARGKGNGPQQPPIIQLTSTNVHEQLERDKMETIRRIVMECLADERAGPYKEWMEVGWCLHHINASDEMFRLWMDFSRKSPKFNERDVTGHQREWIRMGRHGNANPLTEASLHHWAKSDNPVVYRRLMNDSFVNFVEREMDVTHTHVARLMYRMYKNDYCAAVDTKAVEWYKFTGTAWKKIPQGVDFRNKMTTEVAQVISDARDKIRRRILQADTGDEKETTWEHTRMKTLLQIEKSLYQASFKNSVMQDCVGLFYVEDFVQKLNANQFLIGFRNGVVDLMAPVQGEDGKVTGHTVQFRPAAPEDYVTFMAGNYPTKNCEPMEYVEYDPEDPEQAEIHEQIDDFMAKVFPRPELRTYMWRKLASCLEGANKEQTYETWIGVGGNGKSKLVDLMSMTLGDYASSLQSTAMTRKRPDSGAANPDIIVLRNKRFIYMAEPDDREPLNTSRMKQFTGEDDVEARGMYKDQDKFKITGKIFMLCNAFPAIHTMDRGTWRRVRAIPFESKFVDPQEVEINPKENVYPRDNQLDAKMRLWRVYFMSRLVHIYKTEYMRNGLGKLPAVITAESQKYQETFDSLSKFMNARIREIKKGGYEASIKDIFRVYKNWFEAVGGGVGRKLNQSELYKRMVDKFGEPSDKKTFKQLRLFEDDYELDEYEKSLEE